MITVLYVGGCGRSGSTLLDRVLGALPGTVAVGELVHLVERGLIEHENCGCGEPLDSCPFWRPVLDRALGEDWPAATADLRARQHGVDRNRFIPRMVVAGRRRADQRAWADTLGRLYTAIAAEAGASVVVDSSKHASTAYLLRLVPGVRVHVVHLVRDARGMAYSWTKAVSRPEARDEARAMMRQHAPWRSATRWIAYNALFELRRPLPRSRSTRVIYEDFVADPRGQLDRILGDARIDVERAYPFLGDGWVELASGHSVAGNPMRFRSGRMDLREDRAWRERMPDRDRRTVTALAAPLLAAYGYLGSSR